MLYIFIQKFFCILVASLIKVRQWLQIVYNVDAHHRQELKPSSTDPVKRRASGRGQPLHSGPIMRGIWHKLN